MSPATIKDTVQYNFIKFVEQYLGKMLLGYGVVLFLWAASVIIVFATNFHDDKWDQRVYKYNVLLKEKFGKIINSTTHPRPSDVKAYNEAVEVVDAGPPSMYKKWHKAASWSSISMPLYFLGWFIYFLTKHYGLNTRFEGAKLLDSNSNTFKFLKFCRAHHAILKYSLITIFLSYWAAVVYTYVAHCYDADQAKARYKQQCQIGKANLTDKATEIERLQKEIGQGICEQGPPSKWSTKTRKAAGYGALAFPLWALGVGVAFFYFTRNKL